MLSKDQMEMIEIEEVLHKSILELASGPDDLRARLVSVWTATYSSISKLSGYLSLPLNLQDRFRSIDKQLTRYGDYKATARELSLNEIRSVIEQMISFHDDYRKWMSNNRQQ